MYKKSCRFLYSEFGLFPRLVGLIISEELLILNKEKKLNFRATLNFDVRTVSNYILKTGQRFDLISITG